MTQQIVVAKQLRALWFVFCLYFRQSLHHKTGAIGTVLTWVLRIGLTILLYHKIYQLIGQTEIRGVSFPVALSGMLYFAVFFGFGVRQVSREINRDYKSGDIGIWYNKPMAYANAKIAQIFGKNIMAAVFLVIIFVIIHLMIAKQIALQDMIPRFLIMIILLGLGLAIAVCFYTLIGLSALFLGVTDAIENIASKFVMIFGGAYIPLGFFPSQFRLIGEFLPTTAMTFGGQFFDAGFMDHALRFIILQCFWLVVLTVAVYGVNRKAAYHLSVNGG